MKASTRALGMVFMVLTLAVLTGCGNENESEFAAQQSKTANVELKEPVTAPVTSQADWGKENTGTQSGYPGQKTGKKR